MGATEDWSAARNLLCLRLDTIGDVLMATPAMRALKETHAQRLTLLTSSAGAAIARLIPEIDEVIAYDAPWLKATAPRIDSRPEYEMADGLRSAGFDAAVILTTYSQTPLPSAFLCYLAGIPLRLAHCHENPYQLLTKWVQDPEPEKMLRHEVRRQLDLVASIGATPSDERLSLRVPQRSRERVRALAGAAGLDLERPWVLIHPGASAPSRRYPAEQFAAAAGLLSRDLGWQVVLTAGAAEAELAEVIRRAMNAPSIGPVDCPSLGDLAALVELAPLLIANNSGPAHIAAAVGTPVVDLYALTNPQHTPWAVPHRVLSHDVPCKYCYRSVCPEGHQNCLRLVPPEAVVAAARSLMAETKGAMRRDPLVLIEKPA
jgi:lipopolysaccharide heptosyltransferase II